MLTTLPLVDRYVFAYGSHGYSALVFCAHSEVETGPAPVAGSHLGVSDGRGGRGSRIPGRLGREPDRAAARPDRAMGPSTAVFARRAAGVGPQVVRSPPAARERSGAKLRALLCRDEVGRPASE